MTKFQKDFLESISEESFKDWCNRDSFSSCYSISSNISASMGVNGKGQPSVLYKGVITPFDTHKEAIDYFTEIITNDSK